SITSRTASDDSFGMMGGAMNKSKDILLSSDPCSSSLFPASMAERLAASDDGELKLIEDLKATVLEKEKAIEEMRVVNRALVNQIQRKAVRKKNQEDIEQSVLEKEAALVELRGVNDELASQLHTQRQDNERAMKKAVSDKAVALAELRGVNDELENQIHVEVADKRKKEAKIDRLMCEILDKDENLEELRKSKEKLREKLYEAVKSKEAIRDAMEEEHKHRVAALGRTTHAFIKGLQKEIADKDEKIKQDDERVKMMGGEMERLREIDAAHKTIRELKNRTLLGVKITGLHMLMLTVSVFATAIHSTINYSSLSVTDAILLVISVALAHCDFFALVNIGRREYPKGIAYFLVVFNILSLLPMSISPLFYPIIKLRLCCCIVLPQTSTTSTSCFRRKGRRRRSEKELKSRKRSKIFKISYLLIISICPMTVYNCYSFFE
ncbi:hypothetical protein PFISCL1PPCAC_21975, partial [Pristionchus fissidentatus]